MRILVADHDKAHTLHLIEAIKKAGHTAEKALSTAEILQIAHQQCPDLICLDARFSEEGSVSLVQKIRETGGHALWVPIIVMDHTLQESERLQYAEHGADDLVLKPLTSGLLALKIRSAERLLQLKEDVFKVAHELVVANRALQNVVTQDMLTGINNSNSFDEALEDEWFTAKRLDVPLSLILLNLDFFQNFNQLYGAKAGDEVIKTIAQTLKSALPVGNSLLARTTGETFAVLLPAMKEKEAFEVGQKLIKAIEALNIPHAQSGCSQQVTASFGLASTGSEGFNTPWDFKDAADFALYQAKHQGRNRGYLASAGEGQPSL